MKHRKKNRTSSAELEQKDSFICDASVLLLCCLLYCVVIGLSFYHHHKNASPPSVSSVPKPTNAVDEELDELQDNKRRSATRFVGRNVNGLSERTMDKMAVHVVERIERDCDVVQLVKSRTLKDVYEKLVYDCMWSDGSPRVASIPCSTVVMKLDRKGEGYYVYCVSASKKSRTSTSSDASDNQTSHVDTSVEVHDRDPSMYTSAKKQTEDAPLESAGDEASQIEPMLRGSTATGLQTIDWSSFRGYYAV